MLSQAKNVTKTKHNKTKTQQQANQTQINKAPEPYVHRSFFPSSDEKSLQPMHPAKFIGLLHFHTPAIDQRKSRRIRENMGF